MTPFYRIVRLARKCGPLYGPIMDAYGVLCTLRFALKRRKETK